MDMYRYGSGLKPNNGFKNLIKVYLALIKIQEFKKTKAEQYQTTKN
jgi:hypothetical protein